MSHNHHIVSDAGAPRGFTGVWLTRGIAEYDVARANFSGRQPSTPAVIAQCRTVADVQLTLRHAQDEGLPIAVRGGGHSAAGLSGSDAGLVIDLRLMHAVEVDPVARTAWVGAGALAGHLVQAAAEFGLVGLAGVSAGVGLGGLLLHLGEGYLTPKYGFSTDQIVELQMVTASGELLKVSGSSHPDLFWAMRGAGPNYGVVTAFKVRLHPLPDGILSGTLTFGEKDLDRVTDYVWNVLENGSRNYAPLVLYNLDAGGRPRVEIYPAHVGSADEGERELARLRSCGTPTSDTTKRISYVEAVAPGDPGTFEHAKLTTFTWDIHRFPFSADAGKQQAAVREHGARGLRPHPMHAGDLWPATSVEVWRTLPFDADTPPSAAPRHAGITVFNSTGWREPGEAEPHLEWATAANAAVIDAGATSAANTLNHVSELNQVNETRMRAVYGADTFERLVDIKTEYDPANILRRNWNIPPRTRG